GGRFVGAWARVSSSARWASGSGLPSGRVSGVTAPASTGPSASWAVPGAETTTTPASATSATATPAARRRRVPGARRASAISWFVGTNESTFNASPRGGRPPARSPWPAVGPSARPDNVVRRRYDPSPDAARPRRGGVVLDVVDVVTPQGV